MKKAVGHGILELVLGDITHEQVDAIVNAANSRLAGGGGVDGALHRAGGPAIMEECRRLGGCLTGQTVATTAGKLAAKKILHTVGPIWQGGSHGEAKLLASCYQTALELARDLSFSSVAFPSISTGVYSYPVDAAAEIALATIAGFLTNNTAPDLVRMVLFDEVTLDAYQRAVVNL